MALHREGRAEARRRLLGATGRVAHDPAGHLVVAARRRPHGHGETGQLELSARALHPVDVDGDVTVHGDGIDPDERVEQRAGLLAHPHPDAVDGDAEERLRFVGQHVQQLDDEALRGCALDPGAVDLDGDRGVGVGEGEAASRLQRHRDAVERVAGRSPLRDGDGEGVDGQLRGVGGDVAGEAQEPLPELGGVEHARVERGSDEHDVLQQVPYRGAPDRAVEERFDLCLREGQVDHHRHEEVDEHLR